MAKIADAELVALAVCHAAMGTPALTGSSWVWSATGCLAGSRICPISRSTTGGCAA